MKKFFLHNKVWLTVICFFAMIVSCTKMDAYKKYVKGGEILYPGIFDSLKVIPGKNRALVTGLLQSDPKVTKYKIFWNGGSDSLEAPLHRSSGVDTLRQIVSDLPEGPMTFLIRSYDDDGHPSVPMTVSGVIYGDNFQASIDQRGNREVLKSALTQSGAVRLNWADVESYVGVVGMRIRYYNDLDMAKDTIVPVELMDQVTELPHASINRPIVYNTLFIPDAIGIDTLTTAQVTLPLVGEVALLNNMHPVKVASSDGNRWGTLLDWTVNDAAKNHNGYGGTDISGGSDYKIFFEAGYGTPAIVNGKLYQVVTLPPGNYTFDGSIDWWNNGGQNDVCLVAAQGDTGLPNSDGLGAAVGYKRVDNGSDVQFSFTLTETTKLSVGLLLNLGDNGNSMRFNSLRLYINH